jgi:hypothetical protein
MSSVALETFLARLYTDTTARALFYTDPAGEASRAGLSGEECAALARCDRVGLAMAAENFGHKRAQYSKRRLPWWHWILRRLLRH